MASEKDKEVSEKHESKKHLRSHRDEHHSSRKDSSGSSRKKSHKKSSEREKSRSPVKSSPERYRKSRRSRSKSTSVEKPQRDRRRETSDEGASDICHCLGVFGLSSFTDEKDLRDVFGTYGDIENIYIIYDRQSGSSKGFGFVYFKSVTAAIEAKKDTQGLVLHNRPIRVDFSLTTSPHPPTPGRYLGRRHPNERRFVGRGDRGDYRRAGYSIHDFEDRDRYDRYDRFDRYERDRYSSYYPREDDYRDDYRECYAGRHSRRYSPYSRRH